MKILFIHRRFPAQFLHLAGYLAQDPKNEVVFITNTRDNNELANVKKIIYDLTFTAKDNIHHYLSQYREWILHGQSVAQCLLNLQKEGYKPDVIFCHSWGVDLFIKDIFPDVPYISYLEWFANTHDTDLDFDKNRPLSIDNKCEVRIKNSPLLVAAASCDVGVTPTYWQQKQFPEVLHPKIKVIHDGINTDYFKPNPEAKFVIPDINLDLSETEEIVTYATTGMEPHRGFPQFIEAASIIQKRRPNCHIVIGGHDTVFYGNARADGKTYKQKMLEEFPLDVSRTHFIGFLPYKNYLKVLQATNVHVYLTYPYILSWSLLEAMSTGCMLIASDTPPVRELIQDGVNGVLVDFFSPAQIADRIDEYFAEPDKFKTIREEARKTIINKYELRNMLEKQVGMIKELLV